MKDTLERGLAELRAELSPSSADKARLRARILGPALAGGAEPAPPPPRSGTHGGWAALKAAGSAGVKAGALVLGVGVGVGFWLGREMSPGVTTAPAALDAAGSRAAQRQAEPEAPPPALPATAELLATPEPSAASAPPAATEPRRAPPPRGRATRKVAVPNPLNEELALLRRVERALRNADPALALALLGELDDRFPDTRLVEERQAAKLMAHCRMNSADAVARAHAFLHDNPSSVYRQRIQRACELDAAASERPAMKDAIGPDTSDR